MLLKGTSQAPLLLMIKPFDFGRNNIEAYT